MFNLSIFFIERGDKTVLRDHTLQLMSTAHWAPAESELISNYHGNRGEQQLRFR